MKSVKIQLVLLFLVLWNALSGQSSPYQSDTETMQLRGNVSKMTQEQYRVSDGNSKTLVATTKTAFNENGNTVYMTTYDSEDLPTRRYEYKYWKPWLDELITERSYYKYNSSGGRTLESQLKYAYTLDQYDRKKLVSRSITTYRGNNFQSKDQEKFNSSNLVISYTNIQRSNGKTGAKTTYEYDNNGNPITEKYYYASGKLNYHRKYSYDSNNRLVRFDNLSNGNIANYWIQQFNSQGDVVNKTYYYGDGSINKVNTYAYQYDSKGNWTEKSEIENEKLKVVYKRTYIYF